MLIPGATFIPESRVPKPISSPLNNITLVQNSVLFLMNYDLFGLGEARAISEILQSCFT